MSEENKKAELPAHRDKRFDGVRDTWYWKLFYHDNTCVLRSPEEQTQSVLMGLPLETEKRRSVQASGFWNKIFPECRGET